jgi:hypothetical protein
MQKLVKLVIHKNIKTINLMFPISIIKTKQIHKDLNYHQIITKITKIVILSAKTINSNTLTIT